MRGLGKHIVFSIEYDVYSNPDSFVHTLIWYERDVAYVIKPDGDNHGN